MKKKLIISVLVLLALAIIGYFSFQWYLSTHKAESEAVKIDDSKLIIKPLDELNGIYVSEITKPVSSEILFNIGGATATQGTFKDFQIAFEVSPESKKLTVEITANSIYTAESTRDEHLKGDEFFKVESFPKITFTSSNIVKGDTSYLAVGTIEFLGISNDLTVPFTYKGQSTEDDQVEVFEGKFDFDRVKYGMEEATGAENMVTVSFYTALRKQP